MEKLTKEAIEKMSEKELRKLAEDLNISSKCPEKYLSVAIAQVALCKIAYFSKVIFKMLLGRGATGETSKGGSNNVDPNGYVVKIARNIGISFGD